MFKSVSNVKLRGGVVGKVCTVLIVASLSMAIIAWAVHVVWVSILALVFVFVLCFPLLWRLISFAEKNPQAALFEGAEFLAHEQMHLGMKSTPVLPPSPSLTPPGAAQPAAEDIQRAAIPDSPDGTNPIN
jgi:hypothetical protein